MVPARESSVSEDASLAAGPRRVVVTGGAGFIGANLCRTLLAMPGIGEVVVLDDFSTGKPENLDGVDGVEIVEGSILDQRALDTTVSGAGAIVHLAARPSVTRSLEDPLASHEVNATGTLRVLEAARHAGGSHVIVASSSSVYGAKPALPASEAAAVAPVSPYAASKAAAEAYSLSYGGSFGVPVTVYRFFNVFGPLQRADHAYAAVVPAFVSAALAGKALPVHGDGSQTRDFTYVGSVVQVLAATVTRRVVAPAPVNLAFGSRSSLLEVVSALEEVIGSPLALEYLPSRPGDVHDSQADQSRFHALFPDAVPVPLAEGLRSTVEWCRESNSTRIE